MLILLLGFTLSFASAQTEVITDEPGVYAFLKGKEGWSRGEVLYETMRLSPRSGAFRIYTSKLDCGTGVCPQHIFERLESGRWRWIGFASGRITPTTRLSHDHYVLEVTTKVGGGDEESSTETLTFDGKLFR